MNISFVVISNGKKIDKTTLVLKSIVYQDIPHYEILLCGSYDVSVIPPECKPNLRYIKNKKAADDGLLGDMRNMACEEAQYDTIVILDDDMTLSTDWYKNLLKYGNDFDILTSKVILPDGTRFWDHATYCPHDAPAPPCHGHVILESNETDDHLYMSGGQAWMMKKYVFEKCRWNARMSTGRRADMRCVEEYTQGKHNEDTDFSKKCRDMGFKISHNHSMVAYHNDATYTCVGRVCRPRQDGKTHQWVKELDMYKHTTEITDLAMSFWEKGYAPETADVLRYGLAFHFNNFSLTEALRHIENDFLGGSLSDNNWNIENDSAYNKDIRTYKSL